MFSLLSKVLTGCDSSSFHSCSACSALTILWMFVHPIWDYTSTTKTVGRHVIKLDALSQGSIFMKHLYSVKWLKALCKCHPHNWEMPLLKYWLGQSTKKKVTYEKLSCLKKLYLFLSFGGNCQAAFQSFRFFFPKDVHFFGSWGGSKEKHCGAVMA